MQSPLIINTEYTKSGQNLSPEQIKQDLENELKMGDENIQSHAWFHGSIPRQKAEKLVVQDSDFLVRESTSQPGDFVLTTKWQGVPMHFVINKQLTGNAAYAKMQYSFETECFDSIPDLVRAYLGGRRAVTIMSGAVIESPINRTMPLSYYDNKYSALKQGLQRKFSDTYSLVNSPITTSPKPSPFTTPSHTPKCSPPSSRKISHVRGGSQPVSMPYNHQGLTRMSSTPNTSPYSGITPTHKRTGSQPLLNFDNQSPISNECDYDNNFDANRRGSLPLLDGPTNRNLLQLLENASPQVEQNMPKYRIGSEPNLLDDSTNTSNPSHQSGTLKSNKTGSDSDLTRPPPPKPSRIPSMKLKQKPLVVIRNKELYDDDDRDYSDYMQVKEEPSWIKKKKKSENKENLNKKKVQRKPMEDINANTKPLPYYNYKKQKGGKIHEQTQDYDVPQSNSPVTGVQDDREAARMRLQSETEFSLLDSSDYGDLTSKAETQKEGLHFDFQLIERSITLPELAPPSDFDLESYDSNILPPDNKPLDSSAMVTVKHFLLQLEPLVLAQHLTKLDLDLLKVTGGHDLGVGVQSGLELLTLPQGKQLREDALERYLKLNSFVLVSSLKYTYMCIDVTENLYIESVQCKVATFKHL